MKTIVLSIALALTTVTVASAAEPIFVNAREMKCAEFQSILNREGAVQIHDFFGNLETHYAQIPQCDPFEIRRFTFTRTLDVKFCRAGYVCEFDWGGAK